MILAHERRNVHIVQLLRIEIVSLTAFGSLFHMEEALVNLHRPAEKCILLSSFTVDRIGVGGHVSYSVYPCLHPTILPLIDFRVNHFLLPTRPCDTIPAPIPRYTCAFNFINMSISLLRSLIQTNPNAVLSIACYTYLSASF